MTTSAGVPWARFLISPVVHRRDLSIVFEPVAHKYAVDGAAFGCSVSTIVSEVESFNADEVAEGITMRYHPEGDVYYNLTKEEILAMWSVWRDTGTRMHDAIEKALTEAAPIPPEFHVEWGHCVQYLDDMLAMGFRPYRSEWVIYSTELRLPGTIDLVLVNDEKKSYILTDWKRCRKGLREAGPETTCTGRRRERVGRGDSKYHKRALQLTLYRLILESGWMGRDFPYFVCEGLHIVHLHKELPRYLKYEVDTTRFVREAAEQLHVHNSEQCVVGGM